MQTLLRKVTVQPDDALSKRFPQEMPCRIRIFLKAGQVLSIEKQDYEGFYTRPLSWDKAKFAALAAPFTDRELRQAIVEAVAHLETIEVQQLTELLGTSLKIGKVLSP